MASRYSVVQSSSLAGSAAGSSARVAASPRISQPAACRSARIGGRCVAATARSTSSVSVAPHTPVRRILALSTMAARRRRDRRRHRHRCGRCLRDARSPECGFRAARARSASARRAARSRRSDRPCPASGRPPRGRASARAAPRRRAGPAARSAAPQRRDDRARGMKALRAAAQDHGVAGRAGTGRRRRR